MEIVRDLTHVVLDKTGTLTKGTIQVSNMVISERWREKQDILAVLICAAEEQSISSHPLAAAIFRRLLPTCGIGWQQYQATGKIDSLQEIVGRGIVCRVGRGSGTIMQVCIGSLEHLKEQNVTGLPADINSFSAQPGIQGSVVFAAVNGDLAASFVLQVSRNVQS